MKNTIYGRIEIISYEINIEDNWEWVVRYDDHRGAGSLHRHFRVSLENDKEVESSAGIRKYKNKGYELTWVCNDIKRNYLLFRSKFLKRMGLDLLHPSYMSKKMQTSKNIELTHKLIEYLVKGENIPKLPEDVSFVPFSKTDKKLNKAKVVNLV